MKQLLENIIIVRMKYDYRMMSIISSPQTGKFSLSIAFNQLYTVAVLRLYHLIHETFNEKMLTIECACYAFCTSFYRASVSGIFFVQQIEPKKKNFQLYPQAIISGIFKTEAHAVLNTPSTQTDDCAMAMATTEGRKVIE